MIEFGRGFDLLELDAKRYNKTLDRILGQMIRESARRWLRAVLKSVPSRGGFPVITGAAKSTLQPLGRALRVSVPVTPVGSWDRRQLGLRSQKYTIIDDRNNNGTFQYEFHWSTHLLHYVINETNAISFIPSSPWYSIEAGEAAFLEYVNEVFERRLPNVADYIKIKEVS